MAEEDVIGGEVEQTPQSPTPGMPKRGRAALICTPLSAFTTGVVDGLPIIPYDGEFCYDDIKDGSLGYIKYFGTTWRFISQAQQDSKYLQMLKETGLFENALAGVVSKELTYFMFHPVKRTIIFNNKLVFPDTYCFYAIRKGTSYITQRILPNNQGETNLVSMRRIRASAEKDVWVRKPNPGMLAESAVVVDGETYIVEFFDETRRLIGRDVYHAEFSHAFTGSFNNAGIRELRITTSRPYYNHPLAGQWNCAFLYLNESIEQLGWLAGLVFDDGLIRDVTGELNGKLQVDYGGLNTLNLTGDSPYTITFTYTSEELGMIDENTPDSITATIRVFVLEDHEVVNLHRKILPVYWTEDGVAPADITRVAVRYFMFGTNTFSFFDGTLRNVGINKETGLMMPDASKGEDSGDTFLARYDGQQKPVIMRTPYNDIKTTFEAGANGTGLFKPEEYGIMFDYKTGTTGNNNSASNVVVRRYLKHEYITNPADNAGVELYRRDQNNMRIVYVPSVNGGGTMRLMRQASAISLDPVNVIDLTNNYSALENGSIQPTHFRISAAPTYMNSVGPLYFVSQRPISQCGAFLADRETPPSPEVPYIIEFLNVSGVDGDNVNHDIKIINACVAYLQIQSN